MKIVYQRVRTASVEIEGKKVASIQKGALLLVGVSKSDQIETAKKMALKCSKFRVFEDEQKKMNLSILDSQGEFLIVSQFTLMGDTSTGNRPGFSQAGAPEEAKKIYEHFIEECKKLGIPTSTGVFQADMLVSLENDGPVTFVLESTP